MSVRWYYQLLMEEFGPVNNQSLQDLLQDGTLQEGDLVRNESGGDWMLISEMKARLQSPHSAEPSAIEEISCLSELNFKFESSSHVPRQKTALKQVSSPALQPVAERRETQIPTRQSVGKHDSAEKKPTLAGTEHQKTHAPGQQNPVASNAKRKRVIAAPETPKVSRARRISSNGTGVDEDEILVDAGQTHSAQPSRSAPVTASVSTGSTLAGLDTSAARAPVLQPPAAVHAPTSVYSPPALYSQPVSPPRPAFTPPPKKKIVSDSEPLDIKKIATVSGSLLVIATVFAISMFGMPFGAAEEEAKFDPESSAVVLSYIVRDFNVIVENPNEEAWAECQQTAKAQLDAILAATKDAESDAPAAVACHAAAKALTKIVDSTPDNEEVFTQSMLEYQTQIALVK